MQQADVLEIEDKLVAEQPEACSEVCGAEAPAVRLLRIERDLAVDLGRSSDLADAVDAVLDAAMLIDGIDCGGVYLRERSDGALRLAASRALSDEFVAQAAAYAGDSLSADLVARGEPLYLDQPQLVALLGAGVSWPRESEGLTAFAMLPIEHAGVVIGCLNVASRSTRQLPVGARQALESISSQVGSALARIEAEATYRALVETTDTGYVVLDLSGRVLNANAEYARLTGRTSVDEIRGLHLSEWVAAHDRDRTAAALDRCGATGRLRNLEVDHVDPAGRTTPVEVNATEVQTPGGPKVLALVRDISGRRAREAEEQRSERLESIGLLAGGIAHDFNNILMGISGHLSLARLEVPGSAELGRLLEKTEQAALRAQGLTQQLLTFARGGTPIRKTASVAEVVEEAATFTLRGSAVGPSFDLPPGLWPVEMDRGQIGQVVQNLVLNAAQSMEQGGVVRISARNVSDPMLPGPLADQACVRITVADSGCGIPQADLERIFDPYFSTKTGGSGLGLAVAYSIVRKHGGRLSVESAVGRGSTFHVHLPASVSAPQPERSEPGDRPRLWVSSILLMDDDEVVRNVAGEMLLALGLSGELAADGREALARFAQARRRGRPFDLVILDLTVPAGMGGMECFAELRRLDPDVKVVVSSGYSNAPVLADYERQGFAGILVKPYRLQDLQELLTSLAKMPGPSSV